mmetsp:Transcript_15344/g.27193  ORF Transcript_15344/g.27193 Transcript_15344/m.27193 type:complete len:359 (-) Transcript_15344:242-1318(-)|eukprot:CAMPEP_0204326460 /NCGR_PEP_ID=MMETSP0469-20131031/11842_1 /ASSEMBLY_ACC=CAM_ASM_000384 /TAXON_ID=2969 /ORGANISM="Oxyrrhis marina" /LENGTH=358 /DNA_ID=CAMNT_0051308519 /DNA_START=112 /DNA_END=1188 /DNA_ORIENTATION=-
MIVATSRDGDECSHTGCAEKVFYDSKDGGHTVCWKHRGCNDTTTQPGNYDGEEILSAADLLTKKTLAAIRSSLSVPKAERMDRVQHNNASSFSVRQGLKVLDNVSSFWFQPERYPDGYNIVNKIYPIVQPESLALQSFQAVRYNSLCCDCRNHPCPMVGECARCFAASDEAIRFYNDVREGGPVLISMRKQKCIPTHYGVCFCIAPKMEFFDGEGQKLGKVTAPCCFSCHRCCCTLCAIKNIKVEDSEGMVEYRIHQPKCGGMPQFNIYNVDNDRPGQEVGQLILQTMDDDSEINYYLPKKQNPLCLDFPDNISAPAKARLLGASLFINSLVFVGAYPLAPPNGGYSAAGGLGGGGCI